MKINVGNLSEDELVELNIRVLARLKFMEQFRAHLRMLEFSIGDRVSFQPDGHPVLTGLLTRYNKKTVTAITDGGQLWNVSPGLLSKVVSSGFAQAQAATVIHLPKK